MRIPALTRSATLCSALLFLAALTPAAAYAQTLPTFDHIVIIVQENRTPDNLFGGSTSSQLCTGQDDFEPGVDIQNWGYLGKTPTCFAPHPLGPDPINPDHSHAPGFTTMCDLNTAGQCQMDACDQNMNCYAYVQKPDVQQYFDIATTYGFANYMFQTNEGPSFEAHQFLFSGTSAPTGMPPNYYNWFAAELPPTMGVNYTNQTGCSSPNSMMYPDIVKGIDSSGKENSTWYDPPPLDYSYPCYNHNTLIDVLPSGVTWKYYGPEEGSIWSAPTAIQGICGAIRQGPCPYFQPGGKYYNNVSFEDMKGVSTAPVFLDIAACNLAAVSWVIPDMKWSDHPGPGGNNGTGPDYVASLVDAIGGSSCTNSPGDGKTYWNSTAIFIVWDDWGGWYDHVNPSTAPGLGVRESCSVSSWGCGYTYGFRVPLLVVSAYTGVKNQDGTYSGYVSGNTITQGEVFPYIHDFGSILAFTEQNFGIPIGEINAQNNYDFADGRAPDGAGGNIPLADFFGLTKPRTFTTIPTYNPLTYYTNNPAGPAGPGDDGDPD